ncbi:MAG: hypothetical protein IKO41_00280 [Lachnospiraceae bacterium]|nr:hypothetical protein [Lachnospiraceae bacterium]
MKVFFVADEHFLNSQFATNEAFVKAFFAANEDIVNSRFAVSEIKNVRYFLAGCGLRTQKWARNPLPYSQWLNGFLFAPRCSTGEIQIQEVSGWSEAVSL